MDEKLKITPENYEGYCELYKKYFISDDKLIKNYFKPVFKTFCLTGALFIGIAIFKAPPFILNLATANFAIMPFVVLGKTICTQKKDREKYFETNYPNINEKVSFSELREALEKAKILKYVHHGSNCFQELDIKGYLNYIECEKIKNEVINENTHEIAQVNFNIPDSELEKVKVKVKTMIKK